MPKYTFNYSSRVLFLIATLLCVLTGLALPTHQVEAQGISTTAWYQVINQNSNKCVDDAAWGTTNGSIVQQWGCGTNQNNQQWQFQPTDSGYYRVVNRHAPIVWDVKDVATANFSKIHLWTYVGGTNQQWLPESMGGGYYRFRGRHSGRCLDVNAASTADGVQLQIYDCNGTAAQSFRLVDQGGGGGGGSGFVVSEAQFNSWFPNRNGLYQYNNFITARNSYSGFAPGTGTMDKIEAAAFFAHVAHETAYLVHVHELNYPPGHYCGGGVYGCAAGADYHGRGPLQLSWNYNYKMASTGNYYRNGWIYIMTPPVGWDIWADPDRVATDGVITWKTALWYWMNHGKDWDPSQPTVHDDIWNIGFGETTRDINGGLECGQPAGSVGYNQMIARMNIYNTFLSNLGISDNRPKTC